MSRVEWMSCGAGIKLRKWSSQVGGSWMIHAHIWTQMCSKLMSAHNKHHFLKVVLVFCSKLAEIEGEWDAETRTSASVLNLFSCAVDTLDIDAFESEVFFMYVKLVSSISEHGFLISSEFKVQWVWIFEMFILTDWERLYRARCPNLTSKYPMFEKYIYIKKSSISGCEVPALVQNRMRSLRDEKTSLKTQ